MTTVPQDAHCLVDHVVDNLLSRLDIVNDRSTFTEQEPLTDLPLLGSILIIVIQIMIGGDDTLLGQALDVVRAGFPIFNVRSLENTQGTTGEDDGSDIGFVRRFEDGFLVRFGSAGFFGGNETGSYPNTVCSVADGCGETTAVVYTTCGDDEDRLAGEGGLVTAANIDNAGGEDGEGDVSGVSTSLSTLEDDHVNTGLDDLRSVFGVADDTSNDDLGTVELLNHVSGRDTDSRDEELCAGLDDDIDQLGKLTLGVIGVGLTSTTADLGEEKINTEGGVFVVQEALKFGDLSPQKLRCVANSPDYADTTGVGDRCCELRACSNVPIE